MNLGFQMYPNNNNRNAQRNPREKMGNQTPVANNRNNQNQRNRSMQTGNSQAGRANYANQSSQQAQPPFSRNQRFRNQPSRQQMAATSTKEAAVEQVSKPTTVPSSYNQNFIKNLTDQTAILTSQNQDVMIPPMKTPPQNPGPSNPKGTAPKEELTDYGPNPFVINISEATKKNDNFRTTLWTGKNLQLTLMSIAPNEDIGFEMHPHLDQFIRIEEGQGVVQMGETKEHFQIEQMVSDDYAFIIPAGTWHNFVNTGKRPLKLYSIYAPPQHPFGTVQKTKEDSLPPNHRD